MEPVSVLALLLGVLLVAAAAIYKKLLYMRSNMPSPGWFWFRQKNMKTAEDFLAFAKKSNAGVVHAMLINTTPKNWLSALLSSRSHAIVTHPDTAQQMLKDEEIFEKDPDSFGDPGVLMRGSLVNSNGDKWKLLKDILAPAFHFDYIRKQVPVFTGKAQALFDLWAEGDGKGLDIQTHSMHFTLDTLGIAAFDIDFKSIQGGTHQYLDAYNKMMDPASNANRQVSKVKEAKETLTKLTYEIVASKESKKDGANVDEKDFLDRLLTGLGRVTKDQIRDNTFMMFVAGSETTSRALTWELYFLAKYPEMQKQAREEVDAVLNGKLPDSESVKPLTFLDLFIKEALRHRPPIGTIVSRKTTKDTYLGQYFIPKGTVVGLSMYTIHHLDEFWPEPDKFDPLRFTPERSAGRHPFAYLPFSLGRRNCIGNNFSLLEQKIFLAMALQRFTLSINEKCIDQVYPVWQVCWPIHIALDATPRQPVKSSSAL